MKYASLFLKIIVVIFCGNVFAQSDEKFKLKGDVSTGFDIPKIIAKSAQIPFDKKYEELTQEQKDTLASMYEQMGKNDEPPFPRSGLKSIIKALVTVNKSLESEGILFLIVDVSADGDARSIKVIKSPGDEMTQYASQILMLTKFKPALCSGIPCFQQYPFKIEFKQQ